MPSAIMLQSIDIGSTDEGVDFYCVEMSFARESQLVAHTSEAGRVRIRLPANLSETTADITREAAHIICNLLRDFADRFEAAGAEEMIIAPVRT